MLRKTLKGLVPGTPQYVVAHGKLQKSKGKNFSAVMTGPFTRNPRIAFEQSLDILQKEKKPRRRPRFNLFGQTPLEEALGIPSPYADPWPGARKVPHTCYQWY